jgi:hypothetical protein
VSITTVNRYFGPRLTFEFDKDGTNEIVIVADNERFIFLDDPYRLVPHALPKQMNLKDYTSYTRNDDEKYDPDYITSTCGDSTNTHTVGLVVAPHPQVFSIALQYVPYSMFLNFRAMVRRHKKTGAPITLIDEILPTDEDIATGTRLRAKKGSLLASGPGVETYYGIYRIDIKPKGFVWHPLQVTPELEDTTYFVGIEATEHNPVLDPILYDRD